MTDPDLLDGSVFKSDHSRTWTARLMVAGRLVERDTGAVTEAGARDWLRCAKLQLERRGFQPPLRVRADEEVP